jgi:hypothetical protein
MSNPGYGQGQPDYGAQPTQGYPGYPGQGQPGYPQQGGTYPQQGSGYPAPPSQQVSASTKGFIGSLFDIQFDSFVTPKIIRVLYVISIILISLGTLVLAIFGFAEFKLGGILVLLIACPLYFFFYLAVNRVVLEIFMVVFRMSDDIRVIRDRGGMG